MSRLTEIAPGVLVATSERFATTTTVIAGDAGSLVIDPAVTVHELRLLAAELTCDELRPAAGFATHPHWDHVLWCRELGDVPRYAAQRAVEIAERMRDALVSGLEQAGPGHDLELFGRLSPLRPGATAVAWAGPDAVVVTHDGHAPGHSAIFLPGTGTLVAGDMCSDIEIPLLDLEGAAPFGDYRTGLERIAALPVRRVVPGHGTVGDAAEFRRRVAADAAYLDQIERGNDAGDERLTLDWMRSQHQLQLQHMRGKGS